MDLRLKAAIFAPALLALACGTPAQENLSQQIVDAGASIRPQVREPDASTAYPDGSTYTESSDGGLEEDDAMPIENVVDTVRPRASARPLPIVSRPAFELPAAGATAKIPAGSFSIGSHVADVLRDQFAEEDNLKVEMNAFEIDVLPYPNDPALPFTSNVSQAAAAQMCAQAGKRLCTEVEWEYACKSTDDRRYPMSNIYLDTDYPQQTPWMPVSPFGVFAMGRILEWTASQWGQDPSQTERAALRGHSPGKPTNNKPTTDEAGRRCAKRWPGEPQTGAEDLGFRCCKGPVNTPVCTIERPRPAHSLYNNMRPEKFAEVIKSIPELDMIHDNPHMFSDADIRAILARRTIDRGDLAKQGIHFRWKPIRWIPRQGMELWVAVGRANKHSFIVALHETVDNEEYVHASSMILWNVPIPLALAYREGHRDQLYWAPCWGCRDGGTIEYDEEKNEVIITHKW